MWLESELYRLGVEIRLNTYVDASDVLAQKPDATVVATGSLPRMDGVQISNPGEPISGIDQPHVFSSHDVFGAVRPIGGRSAVVIDDLGHYEAVGVAEHLIAQGMSVTYVTRTISFAPKVEAALMTEPALQRLGTGQFELLLRTRAIDIRKDGVLVAPTYFPGATNHTRFLPADAVVFVSNNRPLRELYDALRGEIDTRVIGDAQSPRFLPTAMREGHLAGFSIG